MPDEPEELEDIEDPTRPSLRDKALVGLRRFTQQQLFDITQDPSQQPQPEAAARPTVAPVEATPEALPDLELQPLHVALPDHTQTGYSGYSTAIDAASPAPAAFNARTDNEVHAGLRTAAPVAEVQPITFGAHGGQSQGAGERNAQEIPQPTAPQHQPLFDQTPVADILRQHVRDEQPKAAREVTEDRRAPEPPRTAEGITPLQPLQQVTRDAPTPDALDLSGRDGHAQSSVRFVELRPETKTAAAADLDAWAIAQIPDVARQNCEMWRKANDAAVYAVEHMHANVPEHSQDVETRLTNLALEVRHGFHHARTAVDLIENPTPATLSAFLANAHHDSTPELLRTAAPQDVPAIVISDIAALDADLADSIDALDAAVSDLAHEEAAQARRGASVIAPANDSAAPPIVRDERPTFQDLTDARLDDINAILEEARSNDNWSGAPFATVLTAAAAQTLHRISGLDVIEADTPEHDRAVEV